MVRIALTREQEEAWDIGASTRGTLDKLASALADLSDWLTGAALPLWLEKGRDARTGAFFENIRMDGTPGEAVDRRLLVQARQIYSLASTPGAAGPSHLQAASDGHAWLEQVYRLPNGFYGHLATADGQPVGPHVDLYDQAFVLFALAALAEATPQHAFEMEGRAAELLAVLYENLGHPVAGFEEANPPRLPLRANPHMHLLEAALAWESVAHVPAPWAALADDLARLATARFIDPKSGALLEVFDHDWQPQAADNSYTIEPGHQFEWAWLLARWGLSRPKGDALEKALHLYEIGLTHGICPQRQVAVLGLTGDLAIADPVARLWAQTEWLKASCLLARAAAEGRLPSAGDQTAADCLNEALRACRALSLFLQTDIPGLWHDRMQTDGSFQAEPARATSLYHIVCAIREAEETLAAFQATSAMSSVAEARGKKIARAGSTS